MSIWQTGNTRLFERNRVQFLVRWVNPSSPGVTALFEGLLSGSMLPLTKEQEAALGLELATKRQEHADLDVAIHTLMDSGYADQMLVQRMKKRKLALKDRIVQLENILLPDIIA